MEFMNMSKKDTGNRSKIRTLGMVLWGISLPILILGVILMTRAFIQGVETEVSWPSILAGIGNLIMLTGIALLFLDRRKSRTDK